MTLEPLQEWQAQTSMRPGFLDAGVCYRKPATLAALHTSRREPRVVRPVVPREARALLMSVEPPRRLLTNDRA